MGAFSASTAVVGVVGESAVVDVDDGLELTSFDITVAFDSVLSSIVAIW